MQVEPLLEWSEVAREYVSFVAAYLATGAVGFRYAVVRGRLDRDAGTAAERGVYEAGAARAATLGLLGALVQAYMLFTRLPRMAARQHVTVSGLLTGTVTGLQCALLAAVVLGLALAALRRRAGWPLAAVGVVGGALTGLVSGQWARLVNPMHVLVGGLWIGTLLMLVVAGLAIALREPAVRERRGTIAADMVNGFSPLALGAGGVLVLSGVITAWRHLDPLSSLWTTPYGYALIAKLCVVAVVFALGAWNWRRQRPALGSDVAALSVRRSSTAELGAAAVVLVLSAVLVSLPSPRRPGAPGGPAGPGGPGAGPGTPAAPPETGVSGAPAVKVQ